MLVGVGVDLLHLSRLRAVLARRDPARLAGRILCTDELHDWRNLGGSTFQSERYLALRWTAKEAAYKALYPLCTPTWKDLCVSKAGPKPVLGFASDSRLAPASSDRLERLRMHLSVSHDADLMVAYVVIEQT
ncbi:holo-ACP synthase [Rhodotorula paludigena]|uniref:holo-ACP synthase n=1 Tax=Rhodotorula paludigena TaxID=86838 RepID=UPI0031735A6C